LNLIKNKIKTLVTIGTISSQPILFELFNEYPNINYFNYVAFLTPTPDSTLTMDFLEKAESTRNYLSGEFRNKSLRNARGLFYTEKYKFLVVIVDIRKMKNEHYLIQT
jgi:hypothetical protein